MSLLSKLIDLNEGSVKNMLANFNDAVFDAVHAKLAASGMPDADVERAVAKAEDNENISNITWDAQEDPRDFSHRGTIDDYADRVITAMKKSRILREEEGYGNPACEEGFAEIEKHLREAVDEAKKLIYECSASMPASVAHQITKDFIPGIISFIEDANQPGSLKKLKGEL